MKSLFIKIICVLSILCAGSCCKEGEPDDDYFADTEYIYVNMDDLIFIDEGKKVYNVGDVLWVNIVVPNKVKDIDGVTHSIRNATSLDYVNYAFLLKKKNNFSNMAIIGLSQEDLVEKIGDTGTSVYDETRISSYGEYSNNEYKLRFGVKLLEEGEFKITSHYNDDKLPEINFSGSNGDGDLVTVSITTSFNGEQDKKGFGFTVKP